MSKPVLINWLAKTEPAALALAGKNSGSGHNETLTLSAGYWGEGTGKFAIRMMFVLTWLLLSLNGISLSPETLLAQTTVDPLTKKPLRELFVPFDELDLLIGQDTNRVYMRRAEYEQLRQLARVQPDRELPLKLSLLSANYRAEIDDGRATIQGELQIELLDEGWQALTLQFAGVGIHSAQLDDAPAALAKNDQGQTLLFAKGVGKHRLTLDMSLPVSIDAAQQTIQFQLPNAPIGKLALSVTGNVEIKSGAAVVRREVNAEANKTEFEILPTAQPMSILLSLNNKKLREQSTVIARGVLVAEITQGYERLHATMSMGVLNGTIDEFRFAIADDLEVNSVTSELLSRWSVETVDGQKQLVAKLRSPTMERVVINVRLDRLKPRLADWNMPRFQPLDVAGYSAVVGLLCEDRLSASAIEPESLIAIDSNVLTSALPPSLLAAEPGAPQLKAIAAFYSAQSQYVLKSQFSVEPRRLIASANSLVTISEQGLAVSGGFALMPENEKLFFFDFVCPADWSIDWVKTSDQRELKFDRFPATDAEADPANANAVRIRVLIPEGIPAGGQWSVLFHAQHTPADWLSYWETRAIQLPQFPLLNTNRQFGAVAVQIQDDLTVTPETTEGLLVMNGDEKSRFHLIDVDTVLAYRYETPTWRAALKLSHTAARTTGQLFSFFQFQPEALVAHTELIVTIDQARAQRVIFSLPESTPTEVTIRGLHGIVVNESTSAVEDGRRIWNVLLAERQLGIVRLAIDFTQRLDTQKELNLTLPIVRAEKVAYQSGTVAVEGHSELEIELAQHPRSVDIGELIDAEYRVGKRLLGVFDYVGNNDNVTAKIARIPVHRLPTTIVERGELVTLVSTQGLNQTAARFHLRTKANFLEVRLPADARLWSAMLDGKPALPQREQDRLLIALPPSRQSSLRDLQLVYEIPNPKLLLRGQVNVIAPALFEREERLTDGMAIPIADLQWELLLPNGYRVTAIDGNMAASDSAFEQFSIRWLLDKLWDLGGGSTTVLPQRNMEIESASVDIGNARIKSDVQLRAGTARSWRERAPVASQREVVGGFEREEQSASAPSMPSDAMAFEDLFDSTSPKPGAMPSSAAPMADLFGADIQAPAQFPQTPPAPAKDAAFFERGELEAAKTQSAQLGRLWALEGVRSLAININADTCGQRFSLTSFGVEPRAEATIVHQSRLNWLALAVAAAVFFIGVLFISSGRRMRYMFMVALVVCLVPPLTGWDAELASLTATVLMALLALVVFHLVNGLWTGIVERRARHALTVQTRTSAITTASTSLLILLCSTCSAQAQNPTDSAAKMSGQLITSPEQIAQLLAALSGSGSVSLPTDAIVIPYDPSQSSDAMQSEKLLVPYQTYVELWNRAHPDKKIDGAELPAQYAWSGAAYKVVLESGDSLRMTGSLMLEQFTDREIAIPLNLSGCVLEKVTLDGKPPRLQMLEAQPQPAAQAMPAAASNANPGAMFILYSQGKGRKQLELTLRWKLDKNSGWRVLEGSVPSSPACKLSVTVPQAKTEVRVGGASDRTLYETSQPAEQIVTAISSEGRLSMQWRDKISEATVDQGLTVQARSVFDVQEDSLKLAWHGSFEFRRGRRDSMTLIIPGDYLVQKVVGNNIRGWTTKASGKTQQLDVELLKAVAERETFSIYMSKQSALDPQQTTDFAVPQITIPDAMLHQGHVAVRRSLLLDLRTGSTNGITRIDAIDESQWLAALEEPGPLSLRVYQAYRYSQVPFELNLVVSPVKPTLHVQYQTLLKISQREQLLETRLLINPADRPIYHLDISLPAEWKLQPPELAGEFQWSLNSVGDSQRLQIYLANGQSSPFPIVLLGRVDSVVDSNTPIPLPRIEVSDAQRQSGAIVVQADPAYEMRTENLQGCETALLDSVNAWLVAKQRESARTVIRFNNSNYSGSLRVTELTPIVNSQSVTNVKVTDRAIEETIFIEAKIRAAGIREFAFQLPASMATAKILAPMLRQKNIVLIPDRTDVVRVQLLLQDEIVGQFRVVVEHDHELTSEQHAAPVPIIETGTTDRRLITLENTSRDELVTKEVKSVERLERSQSQQLFQLDLLGGKSSEAYLVREGGSEPTLIYENKAREVLATVNARIGLAQTLIVVDEFGAYRATEEFRVENRTEPFLEVELPAGARLWTVQVAGEPVKPAMVSTANGSQNRRVRLPLIKTAEGELDYAVVLKYGGQIQKPGWLKRVEFPLIHTMNINVELSQVRLRLPEAYQWFNFEGTLSRVESEGDLQAGWLSFRTRQLSELTQILNSSGPTNSYSKVRASSNLKQLEESLQTSNAQIQQQVGNKSEELEKQLSANSAALEVAQQKVAVLDQQQDGAVRDNRAMINDLYGSQSNGRSFNALDAVGKNFDDDASKAGAKAGAKNAEQGDQFQLGWFAQNKLAGGKPEDATRQRFKLDLLEDRAAGKAMKELDAPAVADTKSKLNLEKSEISMRSDVAESNSQAQRYEGLLKQQQADQNSERKSRQYPAPANDFGYSAPQTNLVPEQANRSLQMGRIIVGGAVNSDAEQSRMGVGGGGLGGGGVGGRGMPIAAEPGLAAAQGVNGPVAGNGPAEATEPSAQPSVAFMASLDVELPNRGREFLFSTPRGDIQLTVQSVSRRDYQRLISIVMILIAAAVVWLAYRLATRLAGTVWGARALVACFALIGILSLMTGLLPIYGLLLLLAAIVIAFRGGNTAWAVGPT